MAARRTRRRAQETVCFQMMRMLFHACIEPPSERHPSTPRTSGAAHQRPKNAGQRVPSRAPAAVRGHDEEAVRAAAARDDHCPHAPPPLLAPPSLLPPGAWRARAGAAARVCAALPLRLLLCRESGETPLPCAALALRASDRARLRAVRPRRAPRRRLTRATPPQQPQARAASLAAARFAALLSCSGREATCRSLSVSRATARRFRRASPPPTRSRASGARAATRRAHARGARAPTGGWQPAKALLCLPCGAAAAAATATRRAPYSRPQLRAAQPPPLPPTRAHARTRRRAGGPRHPCVCAFAPLA